MLDVTDAQRWLDMSLGDEARRLVVGVCLSEVRVEASRDLTLLRLGLHALGQLTEDRRKRLSILDELVA